MHKEEIGKREKETKRENKQAMERSNKNVCQQERKVCQEQEIYEDSFERYVEEAPCKNMQVGQVSFFKFSLQIKSRHDMNKNENLFDLLPC